MKRKFLWLLIISVFSTKKKEPITGNSEPQILENSAQNPILLKIEEDECIKTNNTDYIGVYYNTNTERWRARRWSKIEKKQFYNGSYKDEETAAHADTLARKLIANGEKGHKLNFPNDNIEVYTEKTSKYIGVTHNELRAKWYAKRWSKNEYVHVCNGSYKCEETAAHASDTLARKLIANGENYHKLNFPDDDTEVHPEEKYSKYFGVSHNEGGSRWRTKRWSKNENKLFYNGTYRDEETAAHASDTLARKLIANGEKGHKLNFPDDDTEIYPEVPIITNYIGVSYHERESIWVGWRWSKIEKKLFYNGSYKDEEPAAHASDTLARKLIANGEKGHKLNFPDAHTEVHPGECQQNKRKRTVDFEDPKQRGGFINK